MLYIIFNTLYALMTVIDFYFLIRMFSKTLGPLINKKIGIIVGILLCGISILTIQVIYINILFTLSISVFMLPLYRFDIKKKILMMVNLYVITISLYDIYREVQAYINTMSFATMLTHYVLAHAIFWGITLFISRVCRYHKDKVVLKNSFFVVAMMYPILMILWNAGYGLFISPEMSPKLIDDLTFNIGFLSWIITIFTSLLVLFMYGMFENQFIEERKKAILENELYLNQKHYKDIEHMQSEVRSVKHDMKNVLSTLTYLLDIGDSKGAMEILNTQKIKIEKTEDIIYTGNNAIDSVLNLKIEDAKMNDIHVTHNINIPPNMSINYGYMVIILGNILDNAIEANLKIKNISDRRINISIKYVNGMLVGKFDNPYLVDVHDIGYEKTSKEDKLYHGFGINNIKQAVSSIGGDLI